MVAAGSHGGGINPATLAMRRTGRSPGGSRDAIPGADKGAFTSLHSARRARTRSARESSDRALTNAYSKIAELQAQLLAQRNTIEDMQRTSQLKCSMDALKRSLDKMHAKASLIQHTEPAVESSEQENTTQCFEISSIGCGEDNGSDAETILPPDYFAQGGTMSTNDDISSLSHIAGFDSLAGESFASSSCLQPFGSQQQQHIVSQDGTHTVRDVRSSTFTHSHTQTASSFSTVDCGEQTVQISSEAASVQTVIPLKTSMAQTDAVIAEEKPSKTEAHVQTSVRVRCSNNSRDRGRCRCAYLRYGGST